MGLLLQPLRIPAALCDWRPLLTLPLPSRPSPTRSPAPLRPRAAPPLPPLPPPARRLELQAAALEGASGWAKRKGQGMMELNKRNAHMNFKVGA